MTRQISVATEIFILFQTELISNFKIQNVSTGCFLDPINCIPLQMGEEIYIPETLREIE